MEEITSEWTWVDGRGRVGEMKWFEDDAKNDRKGMVVICERGGWVPGILTCMRCLKHCSGYTYNHSLSSCRRNSIRSSAQMQESSKHLDKIYSFHSGNRVESVSHGRGWSSVDDSHSPCTDTGGPHDWKHLALTGNTAARGTPIYSLDGCSY